MSLTDEEKRLKINESSARRKRAQRLDPAFKAANNAYLNKYRKARRASDPAYKAKHNAACAAYQREIGNPRRRAKTGVVHLTKDERKLIAGAYRLARKLTKACGEVYHVDHMYPLAKGGKHHPNNLQVIPADMNIAKGSQV